MKKLFQGGVLIIAAQFFTPMEVDAQYISYFNPSHYEINEGESVTLYYSLGVPIGGYWYLSLNGDTLHHDSIVTTTPATVTEDIVVTPLVNTIYTLELGTHSLKTSDTVSIKVNNSMSVLNTSTAAELPTPSFILDITGRKIWEADKVGIPPSEIRGTYIYIYVFKDGTISRKLTGRR